MSDKKKFENRYRTNNIPWDNDRPDTNLINLIAKQRINTEKVLDIGCGKGRNSIWLAKSGFKVTGIDFSETAIKTARENAKKNNVHITFSVNDFLKEKVKGAPFGFIYDHGCFHSLSNEECSVFAENVASHLTEGGKWFSIIGNADEKREGEGPPRKSAADIVTAVEPFFKIQFIASGYFQSKRKVPPKAWVCLMQKR